MHAIDSISDRLAAQQTGHDLIWEHFQIDPQGLQALRVVEASVYLTRKCNLTCQYCKMVKIQLDRELSVDQWIEAVDILWTPKVRSCLATFRRERGKLAALRFVLGSTDP
jgi:hypothetical protein